MSKVPPEKFEWEMFANWLRDNNYKFAHIANEIGTGGFAGAMIARTKNKQGLSKGLPDYLILTKNWLIVFIELKRQRPILKSWKLWKSPSVVSQEQLDWIDALNTFDCVRASIAYGYEDAISLLNYYENNGK